MRYTLKDIYDTDITDTERRRMLTVRAHEFVKGLYPSHRESRPFHDLHIHSHYRLVIEPCGNGYSITLVHQSQMYSQPSKPLLTDINGAVILSVERATLDPRQLPFYLERVRLFVSVFPVKNADYVERELKSIPSPQWKERAERYHGQDTCWVAVQKVAPPKHLRIIVDDQSSKK